MDISLMRLVDAAGARFCVIEAGTGPAVIFLHAGVGDRRMWERQLDAAGRAGYRAIAYDRRGFGQTDCDPQASFSHTGDLDALLNALEIDDAVLVGCSQGGRIALDYTLDNPTRVRGLLLSGSAVSGAPGVHAYPEEYGALIEAFDAAEAADDPEAINRVEAWAWLDGPGSPEGRLTGPVRQLFLDMNRIALEHPDLDAEQEPPSAWEHLERIVQPCRVLVGALDWTYIITRNEEIARRIPNATLETLDGVAHMPSIENPSLFNAQLLGFLKTL